MDTKLKWGLALSGRLWICLLAVAGLYGLALAQEEYRLVPGDKLELNILALPALEKTYVIRSDGSFYHPELGEVQAAGRTLGELDKEIQRRLVKRLCKPLFRLGLVERVRKDISVLGEVKKPGKYSLEPGATVLDVMALSGGLTDKADPNQGVVYRSGVAVPVSLVPPAPDSNDKPEVLRVGDVLYVPAGSRVSVTGEVLAPGKYAVPRKGATPQFALDLAGGTKPEAALQRVMLIRPSLPKPVFMDLTPASKLPPQAASLQDGDAIVVRARQAFVVGAINRAVPLKGGENLLDVYIAAGAPPQSQASAFTSLTGVYGQAGAGSANACLDDIKVVRASDQAAGFQKAISVDLQKYLEDGDAKALIPISDGDVVFIPASTPSSFNLFTILALASLLRGLGGF